MRVGKLFHLERATLAFPRTHRVDHRGGVGGHAAERTSESSERPAWLPVRRSSPSTRRASRAAPTTRAPERARHAKGWREDRPRSQASAPKFRVLRPWAWLCPGRGHPGGGALAWREAQPGVGLERSPGRSARPVGEGRGSVGEGRGGPGAVPRGPGLRAAQAASRGICRGLRARAYLGLLFRHGCAAATATSAAVNRWHWSGRVTLSAPPLSRRNCRGAALSP